MSKFLPEPRLITTEQLSIQVRLVTGLAKTTQRTVYLRELGNLAEMRFIKNHWCGDEWRWDKYKNPRRIVSACNRYGKILIQSARHSDILMSQTTLIYGLDDLKEYCGQDRCQGFTDQYGRYYTRQEAYAVAHDQGQIRNYDDCPNSQLFSEGLY